MGGWFEEVGGWVGGWVGDGPVGVEVEHDGVRHNVWCESILLHALEDGLGPFLVAADHVGLEEVGEGDHIRCAFQGMNSSRGRRNVACKWVGR